MNLLVLVALAMQVKVEAGVVRDSTDSTRKRVQAGITVGNGSNRRREPRRIPVTDEHLRTAFRSPGARTLLERARASRLSQDSALRSYDATAYMRISAGLGFSRIGRDRLIFRTENATHVRWHRDFGAWIDVKGARVALPGIPDEGQKEAESEMAEEADMFVLPYYPGQEPLISFGGTETVKAQVDERELVHPLAEGAEAYYTYTAGDSVSFRLPDGRVVQLRELDVRPRRARWNVAVGSLWFDTRSGQLVRAAYRLAVPMDIWAVVEEEDPTARDEIPIWVKPLISPMRAQVSAIAVEYGLYQGRFWLPRLRSAEGDAQVSFMRVPFKFEQSFKYASVNAIDSLPVIQVAARLRAPDSLSEADQEKWRDSVREVRRELRRAQADSVRKGLKPPEQRCDSTDMRTVTRTVNEEANVKVAVRIPCDIRKLATSPELPKSIFDPGEEIFGSAERDALIKEALSMGAQPPFSIGAIPPTVKYGLEFTRFNRVEGLSSALLVEQKLGAGYTVTALGRIGHADLEPNGELTISRSNLSKTVRARAYHRLVAANDWGNPLSFGSSLSALLFGRDEGFYYRATGAEFEWLRESGNVSARVFGERQRNAGVENEFSLGPPFIPNISTQSANYLGSAIRVVDSRGLDPNGFRAFTDLRVENGISDSASSGYGRAALDLTFSESVRGVAAALTLGGGTSIGALPTQRRWYLGGAHTVRGQRADTAQSGDSYWLGRLEVGRAFQGVRPVVFGDIGWVGDRNDWSRNVGRPLSGVGIGASILDGLLRFDVSKGIYPRKRVRIDLYVEAKF
jgi:hypothetical protein